MRATRRPPHGGARPLIARKIVAAAALAATTATIGSAPVVGTASAATPHRAQPIPAGQAFQLPPTNSCLKHGTLTFALRPIGHARWVSATVRLNGRLFVTITGNRLRHPVTLRGLPAGKLMLTLAAKLSNGRRASVTRTYPGCAAAPKPPTKPIKPTPPSSPTPPTVPSVRAGSYSGPPTYFYASGNVSFYVSLAGSELQNVVVPNVSLSCSPSGNLSSQQISIASIPIAGDGSFTSTTTQTGVIGNKPATFTASFSGQFHTANVTGSFREDITYGSGTVYSCTSNTQAWTATFDNQDDQAWTALSPGSSSGPPVYFYASGNPSFYVSSDGTQVQNVVVPNVSLECSPSTNLASQQIAIASIPISADGSFSSTTTQTGVIGSTSAKFTYTFDGQFHGPNAQGARRVAGIFREDVTYGGATLYSCTSNTQAWNATFDNQADQGGAAPVPGGYSGAPVYFYASGDPTFDVSPDRTALQDVVVPNVSLGCTPSGNLSSQQISIASIPIAADGSFASTTTQTGVIGNTPAKFTYTFDGQFHGPSSKGVPRVAGTFREDITYGSGTTYSCASNTQAWIAGPSAS